MTDSEIDEIFTYQNPKDIDPARFTEIREAAKVLAKTISKNGGWKEDIERSMQNLRISVFFAIASIVFEHKNLLGDVRE